MKICNWFCYLCGSNFQGCRYQPSHPGYGHDPRYIFGWGTVQQTVGYQVSMNQELSQSMDPCSDFSGMKMLFFPGFNIKILSLEPVKSWKSERSVNFHLDYLFGFKLEHSSWGKRPVQCPAFRAHWNLFSFLKARVKIPFHCKLDHRGTQKW